ncbi:Glu/Leu/Phe/Val family dehydrogenase [Candidatus Cardinium hertigii]|uniref:Leucine dehydrogenase n=1 Tax=Candidatus Cardinium hertigii TaxID=247481 RepID=A0A2Z3L6M6_9BACT|nr:Glu/Leu/Phe/Val dehydrogenase dimerization domain-containing protein [Candidatus Cardinium hertigii]AWN81428.1 Leucine dehydrogenase [Candidatus Cardinium hertigii]
MKVIEQSYFEHAISTDRDGATHFEQKGPEQIVYLQDEATALQAIVAIHDTTLGPAVGGLRFLAYPDEQAALQDVLRLSRSMTYKAAIAGLDVGGGKAVLIKKKGVTLTEAILRKYGSYVERLGGHYITATDYNTSMEHMVQIAKSTRHVIGLPVALGGSGDPSENTAYGLYIAMKAAAKKVFGSDRLVGKKIGVAGVGKVGSCLVSLLCQEKAVVYVTDICPDRLQTLSELHKVVIVTTEHLHSLPLDIYAPCALGASLNAETIPQLNCAIIAGAANNQLAQPEKDGRRLFEREIVYVPDFLANAGGLINAVTELDMRSFNKNLVKQRTEELYSICLHVLDKAAESCCPTEEVAQSLALTRIQSIKNAFVR